MKLAITSDLHLPITEPIQIVELACDVAAFEPDAVVVAGDVGESLHDFETCLVLLKQHFACPIWVLPGNHDLWVRRTGSSELQFAEELPTVTLSAGCHWLEGEAFVIDGVAVAGSIGWYDYSAGDPAVTATVEQFARDKRYYNMDANMIAWGWTDVEFAARVGAALTATLDRLEAEPAVKRTVVVTHVPLLECQMCRRPGNIDWGFSNAYFGNLTLGRAVLARRKVTHVVSGHTHIGRHGEEVTPDGRRVEGYVLASDYRKPAWLGLTLA